MVFQPTLAYPYHPAHIGHTGIVRGPEAVAGKVAELGRKFYPSDIAFNLRAYCLEKLMHRSFPNV